MNYVIIIFRIGIVIITNSNKRDQESELQKWDICQNNEVIKMI